FCAAFFLITVFVCSKTSIINPTILKTISNALKKTIDSFIVNIEFIPIFFNENQIPIVVGEFENNSYFFLMDLGSYSHLFLYQEFKTHGTVGRGILKQKNLFLDFPNARIAFIDKISKLKNWKLLHQIPFEMTQDGVVLNVETDIGNKKFLIDTGCSQNVLNINS